MRFQYKEKTTEELSSHFTQYYQKFYPSIVKTEDASIYYDKEQNILTVEEYYELNAMDFAQ